ncbi:MAG: RidA family protein [Planctomycetota bacterium]
MAARRHVTTGSEWEPIVGYSRAVRVGNTVAVAGTTAAGPDGVVGPGDLAAQTRQCLTTIEAALAEVGAKLSDVVRTRMYVTDITRWEDAGRVHGEVFGTVRPASTMVEVSKLIGPEYLIEIEADAVVEK